jgi:hypothetical protein
LEPAWELNTALFIIDYNKFDEDCSAAPRRSLSSSTFLWFFKSQQAQLKSYVYDVPPLSPRSLKRSMGLRPKDFNTNILFSPN